MRRSGWVAIVAAVGLGLTGCSDPGTPSDTPTVTWGGTFTVDGSAPVDIGGTTTDGPAVQLTAVQAHAVLTNPYD